MTMAEQLTDAPKSMTDRSWEAWRAGFLDLFASVGPYLIVLGIAGVSVWNSLAASGGPFQGYTEGPASFSLDALQAGRWWTPLSYMFLPGGLIALIATLVGLFLAVPAGPRTSITQSVKDGFHVLAVFIVSGLAGALAFVAVHGDRAAPIVGVWPALLGLIAFRTARGFRTWSRRGSVRAALPEDDGQSGLSYKDRLWAAVFLLIWPINAVNLAGGGDRLVERPMVATLVQFVGGGWQTFALVCAVLVGLAVASPTTARWAGELMAVLVAIVFLPEIVDWLNAGDMPWEALLAASAFGALLGGLFPDLLPRPATTETA